MRRVLEGGAYLRPGVITGNKVTKITKISLKCFDVISLNNADIFYCNAIIFRLESLKERFVFYHLSCFLKCRQNIYLFFNK